MSARVFMRVAGQCLLRLTVVMARAFQTKISQNALEPKQSGVLCDMLYFRNNSSSGMTATLLLIYSAGLLENTHTQTQSWAKSHKCQFVSWVHQEQSCYTPTRSSFPCQPFLDRLMLDKCLGSCCSNFYRLDRAVASTSLELLTHFLWMLKDECHSCSRQPTNLTFLVKAWAPGQEIPACIVRFV